jgi:large subunit ribosomal protein L1
MALSSKRNKQNRDLISGDSVRPFTEAIDLLKQMKSPGFKNSETVDVAVNLGVDVSSPEQQVRGVTVLPHGSGRTVRIAVFAEGDAATAAKEAKADKVGLNDLATDIEKGNLNYDVIIASPDTMAVVGKLAPILGPRGLMPNPKSGTVSKNISESVQNARRGQVQFRTDKGGVIHGCIGKMNFKPEQLKENLEALLSDLQKQKPAAAKGVYLKKISISATMSPSVSVDRESLNIA